MDDIRFILEDPQAANFRQKKRSRLVTACDICRAKKIKCHQSPGSAKCEACRLSKSACRFRDRERYHAQRSGSISASSSTFNPSDSEDSFTESPNMISRRATLPIFDHYHIQNSRSSSLPPAIPRLPGTARQRSDSPNSEMGPVRVRKSRSRRIVGHVASADYAQSYKGLHSGLSTSSLTGISPLSGFQNLTIDDYSQSLGNYFDSSRPGFPSPKYMEQALELFFEHFESRFLFLHHDALRHTMMEQALSAPFANCISALSLRFSQSAEILGDPYVRAGDSYLEMAKDLIVPLVHNPSVEVLHSLLLLSWCEYGSGREDGLNLYSALAVQMAIDLGLGNEETIQSLPTEHERTDLRQTWWGVVMSDLISSWVTGNSSNLNLLGCTTALPQSSFLSSNPSSPAALPYFTIHELLSLRDNMLQITNFGYSLNLQANQDVELQNIRSRLLSVQVSLPSHLEFNSVNLRHATQDHQDTVFIFLHLILNSLIAMSHCPSLFRSCSGTPRIPDVVSSSARAILDAVEMMEQADSHATTAIPFLDFPLALAGRVFALEIGAEQDHSLMSQERTRPEVSYEMCNNILARLAKHWGNIHNAQIAVQSGTVWTYVCPVQQSPAVLPSALGLHGVDHYAHVPHLQVDRPDEQHELALTYSDSDFSREPSPLLFDFPGLLNTSASQRMVDQEYLQHPSSDPTPTTMLPPVSLASGGVIAYEDLSKYMTPFTGVSRSASSQDLEYFTIMQENGCLPASVYNGENREVGVPQAFPTSP
ncbi:hypothetical protein M0805_001588, partial [Coniferiporia weirii]